MLTPLFYGITVQSAQQKVDTKVREENTAKPQHRQPCHPVASPALDGSGMQQGRVNEPGDERPGLLGVPAPVGAPCRIGPHGAGDDAQGKPEEAEEDHLVVEGIKLLEIGQKGCRPSIRGREV